MEFIIVCIWISLTEHGVLATGLGYIELAKQHISVRYRENMAVDSQRNRLPAPFDNATRGLTLESDGLIASLSDAQTVERNGTMSHDQSWDLQWNACVVSRLLLGVQVRCLRRKGRVWNGE